MVYVGPNPANEMTNENLQNIEKYQTISTIGNKSLS